MRSLTGGFVSIALFSVFAVGQLLTSLVLKCDVIRASVVSFENEGEEVPPRPARQNAILRAYFRKQYMSLRVERYEFNQTFMEKYVDRQIDTFLDDVDARLKQLVEDLTLAEREHEAWLLDTDPETTRAEEWRLENALDEVADTAGGLKSKLSRVFVQLDGKERLPIEVQAQDGYQEEMSYLRDQVSEAERRICDYLFRTTNTVPYQNLKGENMLIRLFWAEKTAEEIRKQLQH